jgi:hypothetical protein
METKSPLIIEELEEKKIEKMDSVEVEKKSKEFISSDYIPLKLHTKGELSAPKILHFRDYTMEDALNLNTLDDEDQLKALISVLTNMCYEKFDASNLHIKELMEIMYTIHGAFISSKIEKSYHYNEDLPKGDAEGQIDHETNIGKIEVPLNKLLVKFIDEDIKGHTLENKFKEPFAITDSIKKYTVKFRLSRIGDIVFAQEYCNTLFSDELQKFITLKRAILRLREIEDEKERTSKLEELIKESEDQYEEYLIFLNKYEKQYIKIIQARVIVEVDGKETKTIEEQMEAYEQKLSTSLWEMYQEVAEEYDFGLMEKVTFFCEKNQKNITRRFQFQYTEFLPITSKKHRSRYNVKFG